MLVNITWKYRKRTTSHYEVEYTSECNLGKLSLTALKNANRKTLRALHTLTHRGFNSFFTQKCKANFLVN